jgi:prophage tail gpP-like protein
MDKENISVHFDQRRYNWWQRVHVQDSVDDLCTGIRLDVTMPGRGESLPAGENVVGAVYIGDELVSTTRPDVFKRKVTATQHTINFVARSLGRELVDCQYSQTLSGLTLGEIVKRLCSLFKVPVTIAAKTAVVPDFSMQCEAPSNALINAVRAADLLLYPLPDGGLILTAPTDEPPVATLEYGVHIKEYEVVDEYKLRFSEYVVKGYDYEGHNALAGKVTDAGIGYFRPMHIVADRHGQGLGGCDRRAELERNRRQARAHRIELELVGWRYQDKDGEWHCWRVNTQVRVVIPGEGIDAVFLIGDRSFGLDDQGGHVTRLTVMSREAFVGAGKAKDKKSAGRRK